MEEAERKGFWGTIKYYLNRYFVVAMSAMALGLFSSLIIGLIISQLGKIPGLSFLTEIAAVVGAASPVCGAAIGVAIAWGLKHKPLVVFSCAAVGALGYTLGGPVGAFLAAVVGAEIGGLVAGRTPIDIIVTPIVTIISGGIIALLVGAPVNGFMLWLGSVIENATELAPLPMGIVVAVIVGMALTAPISSAAICIMMDLSGLAAGAATAGCCAQMIGFAVMSYKDNGFSSLLSIGLGTSMLQFGNIMRRPQIWLPPTLASAILGPIATCIFKMENIPTGAGMGTSGLVGPFGTFTAMTAAHGFVPVLLEVILLYFVAPAILTYVFYLLLKKIGWIKDGDLKLHAIK